MNDLTHEFGHGSAVVTGAASGIGRQVALDLAAAGAAVLVVDLDRDAATTVVAEIEAAGGTAAPADGDVSDPRAAASIVAAAQELAPLRWAVNNAGTGGVQAPVGEYPLDVWDRVLAVNLSGTFYGLREQLPVMAANGGGAVVNVTSMLGEVGRANSSAYVASKHGVVGLTKSAALEYAGQGVRVNAVAPGFIETPILHGKIDLAATAAMHPVGRLGTVSEVAALVVFLLGGRASFITGSTHLVDGGYCAR
jgi:NAD(P)-dependent dehydrogenase (short-subunit alcohol dehydrogenase family)